MLADMLNRAKQDEPPRISWAWGRVNAERPARQSSVVVIKRYFGLLACTLIALYLSLSPIYALLNFQEYASDVPHFMRYVLIPGLIGATFLAVGLFARRRFATGVGIYGLSILLALFFFEGLLTVRSIPVRLGMMGQFSDEQRKTLERDGTTVRGFTLRRLNRLSGADDLSKTLLSGFPATQGRSVCVAGQCDHLYRRSLRLQQSGPPVRRPCGPDASGRFLCRRLLPASGGRSCITLEE